MRYSIACPDPCPGSHDVSYVYDAGLKAGLMIARATIVLEAYKPIAFPVGFTDEEKNAWANGRRTMLAQAEHAIDGAAESRFLTGTLYQPAGSGSGPVGSSSREAGPAPSP